MQCVRLSIRPLSIALSLHLSNSPSVSVLFPSPISLSISCLSVCPLRGWFADWPRACHGAVMAMELDLVSEATNVTFLNFWHFSYQYSLLHNYAHWRCHILPFSCLYFSLSFFARTQLGQNWLWFELIKPKFLINILKFKCITHINNILVFAFSWWQFDCYATLGHFFLSFLNFCSRL